MDVLCVGNAIIDVFVILHKLQKFSYDKFSNQISFPLGEKIPLEEYKLCLGGNACNVSVGLSRLGLQTALAAGIGDDEFSERIVKGLSKENVDQKFIKKHHEETPHFNVILSYQGERTILEEKDIHRVELEIEDLSPKFIYLTSFNGDWKNTYDKIFSLNSNSLIGFNPGTRQLAENLEEIRQFLPKIEILFVNLEETKRLTGDDNPDVKAQLKKLKDFGSRVVSITDGANGSYALDKSGEVFQMSSLGDPPVERTGAGDSYATGFIYGYVNGRGVSECMKLGSLNANSVIKKVGAQDGLLTKEEIEQKVSEYSDLVAVKYD